MVMISAGGELTAMMVVDLRSALPPQCSNLRIDRWLSGIFTEHAIRRSGVKRDRAAIVRGDFSDLRETRPLRSHVQWDAGRQSESVIIGGDGWRMIHQDPHSPARFQLHSAADLRQAMVWLALNEVPGLQTFGGILVMLGIAFCF